ncbi:hypothetical protein BDD43_1787 [Mucilaginibacter gracilis]|uniref:Uncharacterized protein n=1 Tax=Mucilaginibacter gracilis TaxID=423350 RepID=A0A495IY78_9SPHI|nr:hypothetical protein BDD43_1787 [Mucilaginibacter gracilis]
MPNIYSVLFTKAFLINLVALLHCFNLLFYFWVVNYLFK